MFILLIKLYESHVMVQSSMSSFSSHSMFSSVEKLFHIKVYSALDNDNDNEIILFGHREKTVKC